MNDLLQKSFDYSISVFDLCSKLNKHRVIRDQLLRSASSVGACIRGAKRAESKKDFVHKLSIALKEADESKYWLELVEAKICSTEGLIETADSLIAILVVRIKGVRKTIRNT